MLNPEFWSLSPPPGYVPSVDPKFEGSSEICSHIVCVNERTTAHDWCQHVQNVICGNGSDQFIANDWIYVLDVYPLNFFGRPLLIKLQVAHVDVKEVRYSAPVIERFLRNCLVPDQVTRIDPSVQGLSGLIGPLPCVFEARCRITP